MLYWVGFINLTQLSMGRKKMLKNHNEKGHSRLDAELVIWTEANKLYPFCLIKLISCGKTLPANGTQSGCSVQPLMQSRSFIYFGYILHNNFLYIDIHMVNRYSFS